LTRSAADGHSDIGCKVVGVGDEIIGKKIAAVIICNINLEDLCKEIGEKLENKISKTKMP